jgi:aldehyde dehydrogenase (NAD+)
MRHYGKFYIGGEWVEPARPRTVELVNPATELPFATASMGSEEDVDRAVEAARKALPAFSATRKEERIALFERIVDVVEARQEQIMAGITAELGAPTSMKEQVRGTMTVFRTAIALLKSYSFESRLGNAILRREPIGVVGLITAWNWPVQSLAIKLASALGAGNTVVLKPSEFTPSSAIHLAEVLHEAGVPPGVFNLVNGEGPIVGAAICRHPGISRVSMTGSTRSGILVAEAAAKTVKRVCQELGGKSANVVLPDADLAAAARGSVARGFANSSQSCHAPTRILVQADQKDAFVKLLAEETAKIRVGDPTDPATTMGPVVNKSQFEKIQRYITAAMEEGAQLVCGGPGRPAGLDRGYYVRPTIFAGVTPEMTIAREEIFGPVLSVMTYSDVDEAVEIANGTPFGLGAYVFAGDRERGLSVCQRLQAGRVFYNGDPGDLSAPMGGYKQSGNGREVGVFGLEEYCEVKAIFGFQEPAPAE